MIKLCAFDVLGTEYGMFQEKLSENEYMREQKLSGYCDCHDRKVVVADVSEKEYFELESAESAERYRRSIIRHEIIHAFLSESGLQDSATQCDAPWSRNEEMVDWFAIQWPKINEAFKAVNALG